MDSTIFPVVNDEVKQQIEQTLLLLDKYAESEISVSEIELD